MPFRNEGVRLANRAIASVLITTHRSVSLILLSRQLPQGRHLCPNSLGSVEMGEDDVAIQVLVRVSNPWN
jgi:hypothetical protein